MVLFGDLGTLVTLIGLLSQYTKICFFIQQRQFDFLRLSSAFMSWRNYPGGPECNFINEMSTKLRYLRWNMDIPNCAKRISSHDMLCVQITVCSLCGLMYLPKWTNGIWEDSPAKTRFFVKSHSGLIVCPDHPRSCVTLYIQVFCMSPTFTGYSLRDTSDTQIALSVDCRHYPGEICTMGI